MFVLEWTKSKFCSIIAIYVRTIKMLDFVHFFVIACSFVSIQKSVNNVYIVRINMFSLDFSIQFYYR